MSQGRKESFSIFVLKVFFIRLLVQFNTRGFMKKVKIYSDQFWIPLLYSRDFMGFKRRYPGLSGGKRVTSDEGGERALKSQRDG